LLTLYFFVNPLKEFVFVFIEAPHQIVGDANVHDSVIPVSQKINVIAIF